MFPRFFERFWPKEKEQTPVRLAVLIDAENTRLASMSHLFAEVSKYGKPIVRRAYADWTRANMVHWRDGAERYALSPVQQFSHTALKNAADIAMVIDAMDLLHQGVVDGFVLVTSDSDYTRLVWRLKEAGKIVIGVGRDNTPLCLSEGCDSFIYLEQLDRQVKRENDAARGAALMAVPTPKPEVGLIEDAFDAIMHAIDFSMASDGWASLSVVGNKILELRPDFKPKTYGYRKLIEMMEARPDLICVGQTWVGGNPHVRVKRASKSIVA